ncbi:SETMAR protein [Danaus plexippus plexippus]|uniref:SETMAR protein n=1 Tax=Danaus plexippus plexippus TaxID=278856 RepID=A0A212F383_DANPL|nr:SETMAR protein [Danaus plexippus plexippus]
MAVSNAIIRACLLYEFKLGSKAAEAGRKICTALRKGAVAERTSQKWFKKFVSGNESLDDEPRSGRPSTINNEDIKLAIEQDSSQTCQALALQFNVSDETIRMHLHQLGKR